MSEDRDLRGAFAELRGAERGAAPPFRIPPAKSGRRGRSALRLSMVTAAVLIVIAGYVSRRDTRPTAARMTPISEWRAPTDFLLRTPGREVLDTVPKMQPEAPRLGTPGGMKGDRT